MTMACAGVAKLIEECGELTQVLGKKLAWWTPDEPHWDGSMIHERIEAEMGDVLAAIEFVIVQLGLSRKAIIDRADVKADLFEMWQEQIDNNDHAVDGVLR